MAKREKDGTHTAAAAGLDWTGRRRNPHGVSVCRVSSFVTTWPPSMAHPIGSITREDLLAQERETFAVLFATGHTLCLPAVRLLFLRPVFKTARLALFPSLKGEPVSYVLISPTCINMSELLVVCFFASPTHSPRRRVESSRA
jgi:hypothetical protein